MNFSEKNWKTYNKEESDYNRKCSYVNGKTTDGRFIKFEKYQTNKSELYSDNNIGYIDDDLRKDTTPINLYGATFYGLEVNDEDGFNYEQIINIQDLSNSCNKVMLVFSYIMLSILSFPVMGLVSMCGCDERTGSCCLSAFLGITVFVIVIGFIVDFILCIIIYVSVQRLKWIFDDVSKMGADIIKLMIEQVNEKYSSNYSYALGIIIVLVLLVVISIGTLILFFLKKNDNQDNLDNKDHLDNKDNK